MDWTCVRIQSSLTNGYDDAITVQTYTNGAKRVKGRKIVKSSQVFYSRNSIQNSGQAANESVSKCTKVLHSVHCMLLDVCYV